MPHLPPCEIDSMVVVRIDGIVLFSWASSGKNNGRCYAGIWEELIKHHRVLENIPLLLPKCLPSQYFAVFARNYPQNQSSGIISPMLDEVKKIGMLQ